MTTEAATIPVSPPPTAPAAKPGGERLVSLDALRGFDMFWIVGGRDLLLAVAGLFLGSKSLAWLSEKTHHVQWNGFTFYDLVFPLFVFLVGVAIPFSVLKRVERGESLRFVYWKIFRRSVLLVLLGLIINGLLKLDFDHLRYPHVLARIGLAYFFASIITLHTSVRGRVAWLVLILVGYWAAMTYIPVPGHGPSDFNKPGATLADYVDHMLLPARGGHNRRHDPNAAPRLSPGDPEGILGTIPTIATALMGVLAGGWLRKPGDSGYKKAAALLLAGAICWGLAACWDPWFPINKKLWTSSYVLRSGGWSLVAAGPVLPGDRRVGLEEVGLLLRGDRHERDHDLLSHVGRFPSGRPSALQPRAGS